MPEMVDWSLQRRIGTICPACGIHHRIDFWEILDLRIRNYLAQWLATFRHTWTICPNGHIADFDHPLLVRRPSGRPELVFVSVPTLPREQNQVAFDRLITTLQSEIPGAALELQHGVRCMELPQLIAPVLVGPIAESPDLFGPLLRLIECFPEGNADPVLALLEKYPALLGDHLREALQVLEKAQPQTPRGQGTAYLFRKVADFLTATGNVLGNSKQEGWSATTSEALEAWQRFRRNDRSDDLDAAIGATEAALAGDLTPDIRGKMLCQLAEALHSRFSISGEAGDLDGAVAAGKSASEILPRSHEDWFWIHNNLGNWLAERFRSKGERSDLDEAIAIAKIMVSLTPRESPKLPGRLHNLGNRFAELFTLTRDDPDLFNAISGARQAVALAPTSNPDRHVYLYALGSHLSQLFGVRQDSADQDAAIDALREAVELVGSHGNRPVYLNKLSVLLFDRFRRVGQRADLDDAIASSREAAKLAAPGSNEGSEYFCNLGNYLGERFELTGDRSDLESAIATMERSISGRPEEHGDKARYLSYGRLLFMRFGLTAQRVDLDEAIHATRSAILALAKKDPARPIFLDNLGNLLAARYRHFASDDVDEAVAAAREAVALTAETDERRATFLGNLGGQLAALYEKTGQLADLDGAIDATRSALALTCKGHVHRAGHLNNLSSMLLDRFERTRRNGDLEEAIAAVQNAIEDTAEGHIHWPKFMRHLAALLHLRFRLNGVRDDIDAAIAAYEKAMHGFRVRTLEYEDVESPVADGAKAVRGLLMALDAAGDIARLLGAIEQTKTVRLRADLVRSHRYPSTLSPERRGLYSAIAKRIGQIEGELRHLSRLAVQEQHRKYSQYTADLRVELTQLRMDRAALEQGDAAFGENALDYAGIRDLAGRSGNSFVYIQPLDDENAGLVVVIVHSKSPQSQPAPSDVLHIKGWHRQAFMYFLSAQGKSMAQAIENNLPIRWDSSRPVGWLAAYQLARRKIEGGAALWRATVASAIRTLGSQVMAPVAGRLREIGAKRVVLIPAEWVGLLPLHSALIGAPGTPFFELYEIRYAPSATVLFHCMSYRPLLGEDLKLVGIANPDGTLPFADVEMSRIANLFGVDAQVMHGAAAQRDWLLAHASTADIVALSTHATFVAERPELSYFVFAPPMPVAVAAAVHTRERGAVARVRNERLTIDDIWRGELSLKPGAIVFADACETGQVAPTDAAEEQVGFPGAFLSCGASAVIASLWRVSEFSTAMLMEKLFACMRQDKLAPAAALQAASAWLRRLDKSVLLAHLNHAIAVLERDRTSGRWDDLPEQEFCRLSDEYDALVRGRQFVAASSEEQPFAHPYHWAAFAVYGASNEELHTMGGTGTVN